MKEKWGKLDDQFLQINCTRTHLLIKPNIWSTVRPHHYIPNKIQTHPLLSAFYHHTLVQPSIHSFLDFFNSNLVWFFSTLFFYCRQNISKLIISSSPPPMPTIKCLKWFFIVIGIKTKTYTCTLNALHSLIFSMNCILSIFSSSYLSTPPTMKFL